MPSFSSHTETFDLKDEASYQRLVKWLEDIQANEAQELKDMGVEPLKLDWDDNGKDPEKGWQTTVRILEECATTGDMNVPGLEISDKQHVVEQSHFQTSAVGPDAFVLDELKASGIDPENFDMDAFFHSYEDDPSGSEDDEEASISSLPATNLQ